MQQLSDREFIEQLSIYVDRHRAEFSSSPFITRSVGHVFGVVDRCCRLVFWQTPIAFEYRLIDRCEKRLIAFGDKPQLQQALEDAFSILKRYDGQRNVAA